MNTSSYKNKGRWWLLSLVSLAAVCVSVSAWMQVPSLNPNPKNKVTLEGTFPYSKGLRAHAFLRVRSTSWVCESSNLLGRLFVSSRVQPRPTYHDIPLEFTPLDGDRYRMTYFTDITLSGVCGWEPLDALLVSIQEDPAKGRLQLFSVSHAELRETAPVVVRGQLHNGYVIVFDRFAWGAPLVVSPPSKAIVDYYISK